MFNFNLPSIFGGSSSTPPQAVTPSFNINNADFGVSRTLSVPDFNTPIIDALAAGAPITVNQSNNGLLLAGAGLAAVGLFIAVKGEKKGR